MPNTLLRLALDQLCCIETNDLVKLCRKFESGVIFAYISQKSDEISNEHNNGRTRCRIITYEIMNDRVKEGMNE